MDQNQYSVFFVISQPNHHNHQQNRLAILQSIKMIMMHDLVAVLSTHQVSRKEPQEKMLSAVRQLDEHPGPFCQENPCSLPVGKTFDFIGVTAKPLAGSRNRFLEKSFVDRLHDLSVNTFHDVL